MDETTSDPVNITKDPFAAQRTAGDDPFANQRGQDALPDLASSPTGDVPVMNRDRRMSKEWGRRESVSVELASGRCLGTH